MQWHGHTPSRSTTLWELQPGTVLSLQNKESPPYSSSMFSGTFPPFPTPTSVTATVSTCPGVVAGEELQGCCCLHQLGSALLPAQSPTLMCSPPAWEQVEGKGTHLLPSLANPSSMCIPATAGQVQLCSPIPPSKVSWGQWQWGSMGEEGMGY